MGIYDVFSGKKTFNKAEWAAQKQAQRQTAYETIEATCEKIKGGSEAFRQYLTIQGRFDRYSVNNAILVSAQKPNAFLLKDKAGWKSNRIYVDKTAQAITILEPGKEYLRDDGSKAMGYNAKTVYDVSETSEKGTLPEQISLRELVSAMIDASPVKFQPVDDLELPAFYDASQQTIFVRTGLSETQLFASMSKEVSAAIFDFKYHENRETSEFKSFCIAFMLSSRYGVDTSGFQFDEIPKDYEVMEVPLFKKELGTMRTILSEIQNEMYKSLERTKPVKSKELER